MKYILIALSALTVAFHFFVSTRLNSVPSIGGTYEALAHLLAGFLIGVPFYDRREILGPSRLYGMLGWAISVFELVYFLIAKYA